MFAAAARRGLSLGPGFALLLAGCAPQEPCFLDADRDGYGIGDAFFTESCADVLGAALAGDCDDSRDWVHPEAYDAVDDAVDADCDGVDQVTCYRDLDGDGFGAGPFDAPADACDGVDGMTATGGDCDDSTAGRAPDNIEVPDDGIDQDCDGSDLVSCYYDGDGDGFGYPEATLVTAGSCGDVAGEVLDGDDCDDSLADVHPGALEVCDRLDQDCDGVFDAGDWHYVSEGPDAWFDAGVVPLEWGSFTIEVRLDVQSSNVEGERPLVKRESPTGETEFRIDNGLTGDAWRVTIGGSSAGGVPTPDVFHWPAARHLAVVSEGPGLRFYVDGQLSTVWQGDGPTTWSADGTWTFLADAVPPEGNEGRSLIVDLKELRMWSSVRTEEQLRDGHCRPLASDEREGLELYVPFESGGIDYSGNGRDPVYTNGNLHAPGGL